MTLRLIRTPNTRLKCAHRESDRVRAIARREITLTHIPDALVEEALLSSQIFQTDKHRRKYYSSFSHNMKVLDSRK